MIWALICMIIGIRMRIQWIINPNKHRVGVVERMEVEMEMEVGIHHNENAKRKKRNWYDSQLELKHIPTRTTPIAPPTPMIMKTRTRLKPPIPQNGAKTAPSCTTFSKKTPHPVSHLLSPVVSEISPSHRTNGGKPTDIATHGASLDSTIISRV